MAPTRVEKKLSKQLLSNGYFCQSPAPTQSVLPARARFSVKIPPNDCARSWTSCRFGPLARLNKGDAMNIRGLALGTLSFFAMTLLHPTMGHAAGSETDDPNLWLEDVTGEKALSWVREQNAVSSKELEALPNFESTR